MTSISSANPALLILQQANSVSAASEQQKPTSDNLISIATGQSEKIGMDSQPTQAQSKISESMFSVSKVSVTAEKLKLIERTGEALGIKQSNYDSAEEFVSAMQDTVRAMKSQPGGQMAIAKIEYELGLDKLGISLDDVVDSAADPDRNDKVTQALEKQVGKSDQDDKDKDATALSSLLVQSDDIGLYGVLLSS